MIEEIKDHIMPRSSTLPSIIDSVPSASFIYSSSSLSTTIFSSLSKNEQFRSSAENPCIVISILSFRYTFSFFLLPPNSSLTIFIFFNSPVRTKSVGSMVSLFKIYSRIDSHCSILRGLRTYGSKWKIRSSSSQSNLMKIRAFMGYQHYRSSLMLVGFK